MTVAWMSTGPTPSAGVGDRPGALPPGLDVVGAVQGDDPQARKPRTSSEDRRRRLVGGGHGDGVTGVGDDEHDRQVEGAGGVEALPELTSEVAPSPGDTYVTSSPWATQPGSSGRREMYRAASAHPTAGMHWLPVGLDCVTILRSTSPQWAGIWRPPLAGSRAEPTACRRTASGVTPGPSINAWSR